MWKHGNRSAVWNGLQKCRASILIMSLILILVVLISVYRDNGEKTTLSSGLVKQKWNSFESLVQLDPTVEVQNGVEVLWQIPDTPKAILFLAHGCGSTARNFWDKSSTCPNCTGLPEERLVTLHALARKFAVVTISSPGGCWTLGEEGFLIKDIIDWWVEKNNLQQLPIAAMGASAGAYFISVVATDLKFSSIALMIMVGMFDKMDISKDYPPTLFVHMPKDLRMRRRIDQSLKILRNKGVDAAEIKCMEFPLYPHLLSDRIPGIDQTFSAKFFEVFRNKGFIDENGYMKNDGRKTPWEAALRESNIHLPDQRLVRYIEEELNLAFAYHEMTSMKIDQILNWFESHMS